MSELIIYETNRKLEVIDYSTETPFQNAIRPFIPFANSEVSG